ncbi:hypothetical protein [Escherichia phage P479]|nr:hypothetical protein [Escherichia phage P479]
MHRWGYNDGDLWRYGYHQCWSRLVTNNCSTFYYSPGYDIDKRVASKSYE